jgi:DNA (cytosine-5)-methyltransferase 1
MRVLSLFAGIGGFDLGLERTGGFKTVAFCEIEPFPQRVLASIGLEFPSTMTCEHSPPIGLLPMELPSMSYAEVFRVKTLAKPDAALVSKLTAVGYGPSSPELLAKFDPPSRSWRMFQSCLLAQANTRRMVRRVLGDLAALGYDACWNCIQAADVGAPHIRDRVWIAAVLPDASCERFVECWRQQFAQSRVAPWNVSIWADQPEPPGVADGVPNRMDRVRGTGNAVVPQIPELIGRAILAAAEAA